MNPVDAVQFPSHASAVSNDTLAIARQAPLGKYAASLVPRVKSPAVVSKSGINTAKSAAKAGSCVAIS